MKKRVLLFLAWVLLPAFAVADTAPASGPLYAATFSALDGQPVAMSQLRGKVAVVNFWATWCPPCRKEIPDLVAAHQKYQQQGVAFIGIAVDDNTELIKEFAKAYEISYPLVTGKDKGIELLQAEGNAVGGLPFTLVLDANGNVIATRRGPMDQAGLEKALQAALAVKQ